MIILRIIFYVAIFIISLALFLPKGDILNLAQDRFLKQEGVVLESNIEEHLFFTSLADSKLFYQNSEVADIGSGSITSIFLFSGISIEDVTLLGMAGGFFPKSISSIKLRHHIFSPTNLSFDAKGDFGDSSGTIDLKNRVFSGKIKASEVMVKSYPLALNGMKKDGDYYVYEIKF